MALLETNDTIKKYYESVKDQYPGYTLEDFERICKAPFRFFKISIERPDMPAIYIKGFGKFRVFSAKVRTLLKKLEAKKHFNQISEERYTVRKTNLLLKLKKLLEYENEGDDNRTDYGQAGAE